MIIDCVRNQFVQGRRARDGSLPRAGHELGAHPEDTPYLTDDLGHYDADVDDDAPFDQKVRTTLEKVGRTVLPAFHFRVGFLL